ncbi:MAG: hypothetical protein KDB82_05155 [Planctomycetes bacterium]|nr:hypothetical protein [Planctomycetota bacterium]
MTGSKKTGDYCWSIFTGNCTAAPWYLGGQPLPQSQAKPKDPAPEDSGEFETPKS